MRKAFVLAASLAVVTLGSNTASAQQPVQVAQAKKAEKREEKAEKSEFKMAKGQNKHLLKGIKLTAAQKQQVKDINKKYNAQYETLEKQEKDADKAKQPNAQIMTQLQSTRDQEKAELRCVLTPDQQARFDSNAMPKPKKG